MIWWNEQIVEMLAMAGYPEDPRAKKRKTILQRDLEELKTPDFGESLRALSQLMVRYSGSSGIASGSGTSKAPLRQSNVSTPLTAFRCELSCTRDGGKKSVFRFNEVYAQSSSAAKRTMQDEGLSRLCEKSGVRENPTWLTSGPSVSCRP